MTARCTTYVLDPTTAATAMTNAAGQLVLTAPTRSLSAATLSVTAAFLPAGQSVEIYPNTDLQRQLGSITADELLAQTKADGTQLFQLQGLADLALDAAIAVVELLFEAINAFLDTVLGLLGTEWTIPWVSDLHAKVANAPLTALDLVALIVAIPASALYKLLGLQFGWACENGWNDGVSISQNFFSTLPEFTKFLRHTKIVTASKGLSLPVLAGCDLVGMWTTAGLGIAKLPSATDGVA